MGLFRSVKFYVKVVLAIAVLIGCAVYGVLCSIVLALVGKRHLAQWSTARVFYYTFSLILGIRIKLIDGEKLEKLPAIIVGNHQSALDILVLGKIFPRGCTVTSKKSLKWIPFLGWFMSLSGTFFLDRSNREKSVRTLNRSLKDLREKKRALFLFPEGTRSYATTPTLLDFKKGAFHLAQQAQIPVIPIVVSNTSSLLSPKTKTFERGVITIKVLDPVSTDNLKPEEVSQFAGNIRESMLKEVNTLGFSVPDSIRVEAAEEPVEGSETEPEHENVPTDVENYTSDAERTSLLSKASK